jgi:RND family efflux transporter MFP subunit
MRLGLIGGVLLGLAGFTFGCEVAVTKAADVPVKKSYVANIYSPNQVMVATRLMGYLKKMNVEEGDLVKKGEVLFEVDPADVYSFISQAQGMLTQAQSGLLMAEIALADAEKDYRRFQALYQKGAVSKRDFEKMKLNYQIRQKQVEMAKGMVKQAKAGFDRAKAQLKYAVVKAPIDGVVTSKMKKVAEMALPGMPVVVLSDIHKLRAKSFVKESDIDKFQLGEKVEISIPALKRSFPGEVISIIPAGDQFTHSYLVKFKFTGDHTGVLPGMYGKVNVVIGHQKGVLVPYPAITQREGITGVFVVDSSNRVHFTPVQQLMQVKSFILVKGLKGGEKVVLYPLASLKDGDKI